MAGPLGSFSQGLTLDTWSSNNTENIFPLPSPRSVEFLQVLKMKILIKNNFWAQLLQIMYVHCRYL